MLSIITMALIFFGQCYWLFNQYLYSMDDSIREMQVACDSVLEKEFEIRYEKFHEKYMEGRDTKLMINIHMFDSITLNNKHGGSGTNYVRFRFSADSIMPKEKTVTIRNAKSENSTRYINRYLTALKYPPTKQLIDSLLLTYGFGPTQNFVFKKTSNCVQPAVFTVRGNLVKSLHVAFCTNPFHYQIVHFDLPVTVSDVIRSMIWQLAGSLLLMLILAFCLISQMRTIVIQKRIDNIRHEFMKNMIYEMKQPEESTAENVIRIGKTDFHYGSNELRYGKERVIITSRQAELLRLLAETPNMVVSRERILHEVWGDDSYSNSLALNVQITYLRRALKSDASIVIDAVIKKGYVLKIKS